MSSRIVTCKKGLEKLENVCLAHGANYVAQIFLFNTDMPTSGLVGLLVIKGFKDSKLLKVQH